jgi:hypothetical protein
MNLAGRVCEFCDDDCPVCVDGKFVASRADQRYCSPVCRKRAQRARQ